jgi:hypothetical protein
MFFMYLFTGEISFRYIEYSSPQMSVHSKISPNSSDRTYVRKMYWILLSRKIAGNKYPRDPTSTSHLLREMQMAYTMVAVYSR